MGSDLDARIEALYRLPLADFVPARNALAAELKKAKQAGSDTVRALAKPGVPAWVVNQLWYRHRDEFDALLDAGERLRSEQQRGLQGRGGGSRPTGDPRRQAIAGLLRRAELVLAEEGKASSAATLRRVEQTLQALAALGRGGTEEPPGRLTRDLEPPGFDALLALAGAAPLPAPPEPREAVPASGSPRPVAVPAAPDPVAETTRRREAAESAKRAQARVAAAVEALDAARESAAQAEASRAAAAARVRQTVAEVSRAKSELARAERHAERARIALERAETRKEQGDEALRTAEEELAEAREAADRARG